jgi:hypothetical protein
MGDIHSNAFINIAVSTATDSDGGLFGSRDPLDITPCVVRIRFAERAGEDELYVFWAEDQKRRPLLTPLSTSAHGSCKSGFLLPEPFISLGQRCFGNVNRFLLRKLIHAASLSIIRICR